MAANTRMPSSPRLMRPDFSVMHSPRLTNRNGVLARIAPPNKASSKEPQTMPVSVIGLAPQAPAIEITRERLEAEQAHEQHTLQHQHGGIRQAEAPLQQPAARADAADEDR